MILEGRARVSQVPEGGHEPREVSNIIIFLNKDIIIINVTFMIDIIFITDIIMLFFMIIINAVKTSTIPRWACWVPRTTSGRSP